jgi:PIN domain nuclease of toxin-antitoxin system
VRIYFERGGDTHVLVWYLNAPERLSSKAVAAIDNTLRAGGFLHFSVISMVELVYYSILSLTIPSPICPTALSPQPPSI